MDGDTLIKQFGLVHVGLESDAFIKQFGLVFNNGLRREVVVSLVLWCVLGWFAVRYYGVY